MSKPRVKPPVKMVGADGNAFAILGRCQTAARRAGWTREQIEEFMDEAKSGNYDHLLATVIEYFNTDEDEPAYREDVGVDTSKPTHLRTAKDQVDILFQGLKDAGFAVIEGDVCCGGCGSYELAAENPDGTPGAHYNEQAIEGGYDNVYVNYGAVNEDDDATQKVGERICEIARDLEVPVEWDGSPHRAILVNP